MSVTTRDWGAVMTTCHIRQAVRLAILMLGMTGTAAIAAPEITHSAGDGNNAIQIAAIEQAMTGTPHDFSASLLDDAGDDYCYVCHVFEDGPGGPVVRLTGDSATNAFYSTYQGYDMQSMPTQPDGTSKFCLTCHDGTVAMDVHGLSLGTISQTASLGTDLSNDHPVSMRYDDSDRGMRPASTPLYFGDGSAGTIADLLQDGAVQCSSCHDIHNLRAAAGTYLLAMSNTRSRLCLTCHAM